MSDPGELRRVHLVTGVQVAQATDQATLEARVVVTMQYQDEAQPVSGEEKAAWFGMPPELADGLAGELTRLAGTARERGFEYPAGDPEEDRSEGELSIAAENGTVLFRLTLPNGDVLQIPYDPETADMLADGIRTLADEARRE